MSCARGIVLGLMVCLGATGAEGFQQAGKTPFLKPSPGPAFIENRGQVNAAVQFYARSGPQAVYVADRRLVFDLVRQKQNALKGALGTPARERLVFSLSVVGGREAARFKGVDPTGAAFHYFKGGVPGQWITHVPSFRKLVCNEIYPGTDMILTFTDQGVEYAFEVRAGADPGQIQLAYEGVDGLRVDPEENLVVDTPLGPMKETAPIIFQGADKKPKCVPGKFHIRGRDRLTASFSYGFALQQYDGNERVVIDPILVYSSFLGGSSKEYGWGVAVDSSGCAYVAGYTESTDFPTQNGYEDNYQEGSSDAFVTKYSADGSSVVYSSYLGGSLNDEGHGVTVDSSGCAYVTGYTRSHDFPVTPGAYDTTHNEGPDVFLTKLSAYGGTLFYSTYLGGSDETTHGDNPLDVAVDTSGYAYVTGRTFSGDFPVTTGAYQTTKNNGTATPDVFVSKFNETGSILLYSTYVGGSDTDYGYGIAVDGSGYVFVGGWTDSADFPTTVSAFQTVNRGNADALVFKLNPAGGGASDLIYSTYLGGAEADAGLDLAIDSSGYAYLTGYTCSSTDFPIRSAYQSTFAGGVSDAFVTKVAADGQSLVYSTYLGGSNDAHALEIPESGFGIAVQGSTPYLVGYTNATDFPMQNAYYGQNAGGYDLFLTSLTSAGSGLSYSTYLGGANNDIGLRIAVDTSGNAFATGFVGDGFPQVNPVQSSFGGGTYDAFILKYQGTAPILYVDGGDPKCGGNTPCFDTIQMAIDSTPESVTIRVAEGSYPEKIAVEGGRRIVVEGGWKSSFTEKGGPETYIKSPRILNGSATFLNLTFKP